MDDNEGLRIAALYSLGCPEIRHLRAEGALFAALSTSDFFPLHVSFVRNILQQTDPFVFYQLIGRIHNRTDFFAPDIVKAHWLSNDLLKELSRTDIELLIAQGVIPATIHGSEVMIVKLINLIGGLPHHNFVVFSLIKRARQDIQLPLDFWAKFNNCLVRTGRIINANHDLTVQTIAVVQKDGRFALKQSTERIPAAFVSGAKVGDCVSHHLGKAREKLSDSDAAALDSITQQAFLFFQKGQ